MKNKKLKRMVAIFLALSIVMCLSACSGKDDKEQKANAEEKNGKYKVGDCITFGAYEQDNDTSNGKEDIEWIVLDKQDGKALVVSKYALDCKQYHEVFEEVTWETCTLRSWFNNEFINDAFTTEEQSKIPTVTVKAEDNKEYGSDAGNDTQDKVFLLSIGEAEKFCADADALLCKPTAYAEAQGLWVTSESDASSYGIDSEYVGNCWAWWLRTPGCNQYNGTVVLNDGTISGYDCDVDADDWAVRPAMWINL